MSPDTRTDRRRALKRSRLPDFATFSRFSTLSRPTVVKSLIGLGLASSVAAAVALPIQAAPGQVQLTGQLSGETSSLVARDRVEAASGTTSRSVARTSMDKAATSVTAPAKAEGVKVSAGPVGVTAIAKPKPAPVPAKSVDKSVEKDPSDSSPKQSSSNDSSSNNDSSNKDSSSNNDSSNNDSTSVPSGVGSGAYVGWCSSKGLGSGAATICSAVRSNFGITSIGGYRAGAGDHGTGKAVDVMVAGSTGDAVAQWAINNMGRLNISYVIWKQRIWLSGASGWRSMEDRGSATANHYDHVHISVN